MKGIVECRMAQSWEVSVGDNLLFRQLYPKRTTIFGQVFGEYEEVVRKLVKDIDLGKSGKIISGEN